MKRLAVGFLLLICTVAGAQTPNFVPIELLKKNEAVQVNVVFPDRVGYLWIGTNKGLFRFDGLKSKHFKKSDGFPDENITALAQDSLGRIWCGHKNGEISIVEKNTIAKFEPNEGSAAGLISDILFDRSGVLWFSTNNDGLYYYLNERLYRIDENEGLTDLFFYDLEEDHEGKIWAVSDGGIAVCSLKGTALSVQTISSKEGLPDNIIHKIHQDADSTFWLGTEDSGIIHYLPAKNKFETIDLSLKAINDFVLEGNNIWLATKDAGVILYDKLYKKLLCFMMTYL
jgi:ligand-binding sensor domain-containing protein